MYIIEIYSRIMDPPEQMMTMKTTATMMMLMTMTLNDDDFTQKPAKHPNS